MRPAILLCLSVAFVCNANAQFTILPQFGLENTETIITYNKHTTVIPFCENVAPQAAVRFSYAFKNSHGPFMGLATSRSVVQYSFSDPETGMEVYTAYHGNTQLRFEGGYQVSTKRIYFTNAPNSNHSLCSYFQAFDQLFSCTRSKTQTGSAGKEEQLKDIVQANETRAWMRIQPSVGIAYVPHTPSPDIYVNSGSAEPVYTYNAGNWTTALLAGVNFEFGRGTQSTFSISMNCINGLGNGTKSITTGAANKAITTSLKSYSSACNIRIGIPITFTKKQTVSKQQPVEQSYKHESRCSQYRSCYHESCIKKL